jgi:hypothetical protein
MKQPLLIAMRDALAEAWVVVLHQHYEGPLNDEATERASNAIQSLALYEPGDSIEAALASVIDGAIGEFRCCFVAHRERLIHVGLESIAATLLSRQYEQSAREVFWDAFMQTGLR